MKYTLIYRSREGAQVIQTLERFTTKESAFLALARCIVGLAETSDQASLNQVTIWLDAPSGRRLVRLEVEAGAMAKAFAREVR